MKELKDYLDYLRSLNRSPQTVKSYQQDIKSFFGFFKGSLDKIARETIQTYTVHLRNLGNSPNTVRRKLLGLKSFLTFLEITVNIDFPKCAERLPIFLNKSEITRMRKATENLRDRAVLELLLSSGVRVSELHSADRDQPDFNSKSIKINGKGDKERIVFFDDRAKAILLEYLNSRKDSNPALFINRLRKRLSVRMIENTITDLGRRAGLKKRITPHTLRHTLATDLWNNGADILFIAELLGHKNLNTTHIYTHLTNKKKQRYYQELRKET